MAGRPVTIHGGQSGMLYGLIAFAVVSVASLGLFIFQLTKNKKLTDQAQTAQSRLQRYGSPPAYYGDEADSRRSNVFAVMTQDLRDVATLVTGVPDDVGAAIVAKSDRILSDVAGRTGAINRSDTLLTALMTLADAHAKEKAAADDMARTVEDLQSENAALTEQLRVTRDEFEAQTQSLSQQLQATQEDKISAVQQKDAQLQELQATLDATEAQLQTINREGSEQVREIQLELQQREALIGDLQNQIRDLKPATFDRRQILTSADGRILRSIPGSDIVYINLGTTDRMKPGMGFEVYSQAGEATSTRGRTTVERGKASIEIVTVMEQTSECRVTRREPGQPIMEGDIIVNIAFERQREPRFVVRGDFDLNYDGQADYNGVDLISAMIRQWGGQVVEDVDESVDYVVIGLPPRVPQLDDPGVSDVVRDQAVQKELERGRFAALVERAQRMFIPVITANQFLFLTGNTGDQPLGTP